MHCKQCTSMQEKSYTASDLRVNLKHTKEDAEEEAAQDLLVDSDATHASGAMQAQLDHNKFPLLDAPCSWLFKLITQHCDHNSKLSLFQTCSQLMEVVMQYSQSTSLDLDLLSQPLQGAFRMLGTASRHAPRVNLRLYRAPFKTRFIVQCHTSSQEWPTAYAANAEEHKDADMLMSDTLLGFLRVSAEKGATQAVTELTLEGAHMKTFLPPTAGHAYPQLTKLSLRNCMIDQNTAVLANGDFQSLQCLELHTVKCEGLKQGDTATSAYMQHMFSQIGGFQALSSLTIVGWGKAYEFPVINTLAPQLTHLCFNTEEGGWNENRVRHKLKPLDWVLLGGQLRHLQLPGITADDEAMRMFLDMPYLTRLEVDFQLTKSFAGQPCKWEELAYDGVMPGMHARLPLHSNLILKFGTRWQRFDPDESSLPLLQDEIRSVQRCKNLVWGDAKCDVVADDMEQTAFDTWLMQARPLYVGARQLLVHHPRLSKAAMRALGRFVRNRDDRPFISLSSRHWRVKDGLRLIRKMPNDSTIGICLPGTDNDEQTFIRLCLAAQHRLTLSVHCWKPLQPGLEQRIQPAMGAAGLQVVSLECRSPTGRVYSLTITIQPCHTSGTRA